MRERERARDRQAQRRTCGAPAGVERAFVSHVSFHQCSGRPGGPVRRVTKCTRRVGRGRDRFIFSCIPFPQLSHFKHCSPLFHFISFSFRLLMSFHVFSRTFLFIMFRFAPPRMFRHFLEFSSVFVLLVYRFVLFLYFLLLPRALARGASPRAAAWGVAGQQALWGRVGGVTPPL